MQRKPLGAAYWKQLAGQDPQELGESFAGRLICPDDDTPLTSTGSDGGFFCSGCGREYTHSDGVLSILPGDDLYMTPPEEARGVEAATSGRQIMDPRAEFNGLWEAVERQAGGLHERTVLDLCCGTAWAAAWFAREGAEVLAADLNNGSEALQSALERRRRDALRFDLLQVDACRIPLEPETFDVVFIAASVHLLKHPARVVQEAARVMKPDGVLLNVDEPLSSRMNPAGPRKRIIAGVGRSLSHNDYAAIYHEAGLDLTPVFPGEENTDSSGWIARLKRHLRATFTRDRRLFVGRKSFAFELPTLRIPRRKRENDNE